MLEITKYVTIKYMGGGWRWGKGDGGVRERLGAWGKVGVGNTNTSVNSSENI